MAPIKGQGGMAGRKVWLALAGVAGVALSMSAVSLGTTPSAVAAIQSDSDSVDIASLPGTAQLELDQFNAAAGTLNSVTVTATLAGQITATVWNLTDAPRSTTVRFNASAESTGPGVDLDVAIQDSLTETLPPDVPREFDLSATDDDVQTITGAGLAAFIGTGTVTFDVNGIVDVNVFGPAAWRTRGVARAVATVRVDYDFTETGSTTTTSSTSTTTTTVPPSTTTTSTTTTTLPPTTTTSTTTTTTTTSTTLPPTTTTTTLPPTTTTTTTLPPTTTTTTPPVCVVEKLFVSVPDDFFTLPVGSYLGGRFTIVSVNNPADPTVISWTSTGRVQQIWVDRFPSGPPDADYGAGVYSGTVSASGNDTDRDYLHVRICDS